MNLYEVAIYTKNSYNLVKEEALKASDVIMKYEKLFPDTNVMLEVWPKK